jgi:tetratricopeptide (TPR) repeat protein
MSLASRILFGVTSPRLRRFVHDRLLPRDLAVAFRRKLGLLPAASAPTSPRLDRLIGRLWGGFSAEAANELLALTSTPTTSSQERAAAHLALATWFASRAEWTDALHHARSLANLSSPEQRLGRQLLLEADCLLQLGQNEEARSLLSRALDLAPHDNHLRLVDANSWAEPAAGRSDDAARLAQINVIYQRASLAPLQKRNEDLALSLDNLVATANQVSSGPLVSVLMPAYRAEGTLGFAVRSVLEQTWRNLELIVVDDLSPDSTFELAQTLTESDQRVRVIQLPENQGAYAARNAALRQAQGEYVTVHDADDWSHPQKIELQLRQLARSKRAQATKSEWVRSLDHLYFRGNTPATSSWITPNVSSLLLRAGVLRNLGGWDEVRVAADSDLERRLAHLKGSGAILHTEPGVPLSFALESPTSLTRAGATHVSTARHGLRRTYHDASKHWLSKQTAELPRLRSNDDSPRAFPAPVPLLSTRGQVELDVLLVAELLEESRDLQSTLAFLASLTRAGQRVGVLHFPRPHRSCQEPISPRVLDTAERGELYVVSAGERLTASLLIACSPAALSTPMDRPPEVTSNRGALWVTQAAWREGVDCDHAVRTFEATFAMSPLWIPADAGARQKLEGVVPISRLYSGSWSAIAEVEEVHRHLQALAPPGRGG